MHLLGWSWHAQRTGGLTGTPPPTTLSTSTPTWPPCRSQSSPVPPLRRRRASPSRPLPPANSWLVPVLTSLVSGLGDAPNSPRRSLSPGSFLSPLHSFFFLHFSSHWPLLGSGLLSFLPSPLLTGLPHSPPTCSLGAADFITFQTRRFCAPAAFPARPLPHLLPT